MATFLNYKFNKISKLHSLHHVMSVIYIFYRPCNLHGLISHQNHRDQKRMKKHYQPLKELTQVCRKFQRKIKEL